MICRDSLDNRLDALVRKKPVLADIVKVKEQLENDLAALRKLRDDDASGALKEYFGDGEDPLLDLQPDPANFTE